MTALTVKEYSAPPINVSEILRYMGSRSHDPSHRELAERAIALVSDKLTYRACFAEFPLVTDGDVLDMGFARCISRDLSKCLEGCSSVVLFAATVGLEIDKLILKYSRTTPSVALALQAFGAERAEALCDLVARDVAIGRGETTPRFSPGYGDLPLELQKDVFSALDCSRRIGLTLNDSLLMSPTKSVTAIIGVRSPKELN